MSFDSEYMTAYNDYSPDEFQSASLNRLRERAKQSARRTCYIVRPDCIFTDRTELRWNTIVVVPLLGRQRDSLDTSCPDIYTQDRTSPDGRRIGCLILADEAIALNLLAVYHADVQREEDLHVLWLFDDGAVLSTYYISEDEETMCIVELMRRYDPHDDDSLPCFGKPDEENSFTGVFEFLDLTDETNLTPGISLPERSPPSTIASCQSARSWSGPILRDAGIHIS